MIDNAAMANISDVDDGMQRFFGIRTDAKGEEFEARSVIMQDHVPIVRENHWFRMTDPRNGFSKSRDSRKVACVPILAMQVAKDNGWDLDDQTELRRWLEQHPEFLTVQSLRPDRNASHQIIIK